MQGLLDAQCRLTVKDTCNKFAYARYNTVKGRWRCYENIDHSSTTKSCVNDAGERIQCSTFAADSAFCTVDALNDDEGC